MRYYGCMFALVLFCTPVFSPDSVSMWMRLKCSHHHASECVFPSRDHPHNPSFFYLSIASYSQCNGCSCRFPVVLQSLIWEHDVMKSCTEMISCGSFNFPPVYYCTCIWEGCWSSLLCLITVFLCTLEITFTFSMIATFLINGNVFYNHAARAPGSNKCRSVCCVVFKGSEIRMSVWCMSQNAFWQHWRMMKKFNY